MLPVEKKNLILRKTNFSKKIHFDLKNKILKMSKFVLSMLQPRHPWVLSKNVSLFSPAVYIYSCLVSYIANIYISKELHYKDGYKH